MARSDVSSLDVDVEKLDAFSFGERPISITGDQLSARRGSIAGSQLRGRPVSRGVSPSTSRPPSTASRPQSRNFSRPSPRSSFTESNIHPAKRRRSSDYERELARVNRPHSVSPDFHTPSPLSRSESASEGSLPPFAPKAMLQAELREPPPVPLPPLPSLPLYSPPSSERLNRSRKSTRSMDILEAARQQQLPMHNGGSTRELLSTITEKSRVEPSTFAQRVFTAGKPDLLYELRERKRLKDRRNGVLDFTTLERMNTHVLQQKLVEQVKAIGEKNAWMEIGIKETLHDYCEAVRDMEYMEQCALRGTNNDPFLLSTAKAMDCKLLEDAGLAFGDPRKKLTQSAPDRLAFTKRDSLAQRGFQRLLMAVLGGLAIIAPFLIMMLVSGQLTRLLVTCLFMVAFAVGATLGSELGPDRIALVTAAYAAALMVFVGTNPPSYRH